jgi:hypothetical protein
MIVLAREVFLCKCSTQVGSSHDHNGGDGEPLRFTRGTPEDVARLDPKHHNRAHADDFRERLSHGERWVLGLRGGRVATYTWLHTRGACAYRYLPGCSFALPDDFGYGYDAWTDPQLRGAGLRRRAFVEELHVLSVLGKAWEASFFVAHQLEGAQRSLARVGITIVPLWRVTLGRDRQLVAERIGDGAGDDAGARFTPAG